MYPRNLVAFALVLGCGGDPRAPAIFPSDYARTHQEVRDCRFSLDHDLMRIRVLASPDAVMPYLDQTPFPTGATLIKEQFDEADETCSGPVVGVTAMQKLDVGSSPDTIEWLWQEVGPDLLEQERNADRCIRCHTRCGGFDGTCTMP